MTMVRMVSKKPDGTLELSRYYSIIQALDQADADLDAGYADPQYIEAEEQVLNRDEILYYHSHGEVPGVNSF